MKIIQDCFHLCHRDYYFWRADAIWVQMPPSQSEAGYLSFCRPASSHLDRLPPLPFVPSNFNLPTFKTDSSGSDCNEWPATSQPSSTFGLCMPPLVFLPARLLCKHSANGSCSWVAIQASSVCVTTSNRPSPKALSSQSFDVRSSCPIPAHLDSSPCLQGHKEAVWYPHLYAEAT